MKKIKFLLVAMIAILGLALSVPEVFAKEVQIGTFYNGYEVIPIYEDKLLTLSDRDLTDRPGEFSFSAAKVRLVYSRFISTGKTFEDFGAGDINEVEWIGIYYDGTNLSWEIALAFNDIDFEVPYNELADGLELKFSRNDVVDNKRPVISGKEVFVTNVDDAKPIEWFLDKLTAYDETDGDVSDTIKVVQGKDNYTANRSKPGIYEVTVEARDKSDNVAEVVIKIQVVDVTAPVITGDSSTAKISYTKVWNADTFKKTLKVSDNVDDLNSDDITLASKDNGYAGNETKLGTYTVTFKVKDTAGNTASFDKKVQVIDDVKPSFTGPSIIATSNTTILTESDVREQLTAYDDIDGTITSKIELIEDNYTGKGNKVGSYTITYQVSDNAGNTATHTVTIERKDEIPPVIWVEDGVSIKTNDNTPLSQQQIIDILQATGQIQVTSTTTFKFEDHDDYYDNQDQVGVYQMGVKARSQDGNEKEVGLSIWVLASQEDEDIKVSPEFNLETFLKENWLYVTITIILLTTIIYVYIRRK